MKKEVIVKCPSCKNETSYSNTYTMLRSPLVKCDCGKFFDITTNIIGGNFE